MYLRGALDSAHFHRMRKANIYQKDAAGKTLQILSMNSKLYKSQHN
jgi:hypothetical protein